MFTFVATGDPNTGKDGAAYQEVMTPLKEKVLNATILGKCFDTILYIASSIYYITSLLFSTRCISTVTQLYASPLSKITVNLGASGGVSSRIHQRNV